MKDSVARRRLVRPRNVAFAAGLVIVAVLFVLDMTYHEPVDDAFLDGYNEFDAYELVNEQPAVYEVSKDGSAVGYLVLEGHYGYQSEVVMATLVDTNGTVLDARAYSQEESPSYFRKLVGSSFFKNNFVGDPIADGFSIDANVDAISHATISSNAATKAVQEGVSFVGEHYLDISVATHDNGIAIGYLDVLVFMMLVLALLTSRFAKKKILVWGCRVYSIVVMGFMASQFITLAVLLAFFSLDWPSVVDYLRWYLLVFGVLLIILGTGKNVYCAYICPFGALEEAVFALGGPIGKKPLNPRVGKLLRWFPGVLVFISLVLALGLHNLDYTNYEPFSLIFGQVGIGIQWVLLPLVLLGALFSRRIYCNFACPVGYVLRKIVAVRSKATRFIRRKTMPKEPVTPQAAGDATVPERAGKTEKHPMKAYDWLVLLIGIALVVVSFLTIIGASGLIGG